MKVTHHDFVAQHRRSLVLFECKLGHKVSADQGELAQLLLKPFRIPFEVSQQLAVCGHEDGRNVHQELPQRHAVTALMRRAQKEDAVRGQLDRAVLL